MVAGYSVHMFYQSVKGGVKWPWEFVMFWCLSNAKHNLHRIQGSNLWFGYPQRDEVCIADTVLFVIVIKMLNSSQF